MESIQVFYRNIGQIGVKGRARTDTPTENRGSGFDYYHKYIVYTASDGKQYAASGWPDNNSRDDAPKGNVKITVGPYNSDYPDHPDSRNANGQSQFNETIKTGDDLSSDWQKITQAMREIGNEGHVYDPINLNSNTTVDEALDRAGLPQPEDDGFMEYWSPGSGIDIPGGDDTTSETPPSFGEQFSEYLNSQLGLNIKNINHWWNQAKSWVLPRRDPLALDLDGDGIETRGADGQVVFDHNGDGVQTGTGWLRPDDGWLVLDRNSNGTIDNGGELFGVDTVKADGTKATDGFDALSDLDSNNDDVFDAKDTRFADVRVWRDLNQDGVSQSNELSTLAANNIRSINLNKTSTTTNLGNGNAQTATATFTRTDDTTGNAANLELASNTFYRKFTKAVALTDKAKELPEASGSGAVRNLRQAISRYSTLNEYRLPPGSGNGGFIAGAKHTWGPAHE